MYSEAVVCQPGRPLSLAGVISETHTVFFDFYSREQNMIIISDLRGFMGSVIKPCHLSGDLRLTTAEWGVSCRWTRARNSRWESLSKHTVVKGRSQVEGEEVHHRFHTEDGKKQALYFATRSIFPNLCSFDVASNHEESAEQTPCLPLEHQQQQVTARFFVSFRTKMFFKKNVAKINMNKH